MTSEEVEETKPETELSVIEQARILRQELEQMNIEAREILKQRELLFNKEQLGGRAIIGGDVKPKEQTPQEYSEMIMSGNFKGGSN